MILKRFNVTRSTDDPHRIQELIEKGYKPVKDHAERPPKPQARPKASAVMLKSELVELAEQQGIRNAKSLTKAELLEVLA